MKFEGFHFFHVLRLVSLKSGFERKDPLWGQNQEMGNTGNHYFNYEKSL
jgi:hypothetical protein